jgi:hypothetical protein
VNAEGFDFYLSAASPCIDAGINVGLTWDYEKFAVPYGGAVDMGALEFHGTDLDQVQGYSYKYTFTNGDYYQGVVYAQRDYGYDIGYSKNITDEHGLPGNYLITDIVASENNLSKDGQVFVSTYYDAESKKTYAPLNSASVAGSQHLQSESGYIIKAGIADFAFGKGYWEADLGACYNFTYRYGNGDYYQGQVYASQDYGYYPGWKKQVANETGYVGYYEINSLSYIEDVSNYGQLFVNKYYDKETRKKYSIINFSGNNYLGSESGYIISANLGSHFFAYGFYEADKK